MSDMKSEPVKDSSAQYSDNSKSSGMENMFFTETSTCIMIILI